MNFAARTRNIRIFRMPVALWVSSGLFAIVAIAMMLISFAATPTAHKEAETGVLTGGVTQVSSAGASGGNAIRFASGTKPGPNNTGVPAGHTLTPAVTNSTTGISVDSSGNVTISKAGTFENLLIRGRLKINTDDVTLRYVRIEGNPNPSDFVTDPVSYEDCMAKGAYTVNTIVAIFNRHNVLIEDSTIAVPNAMSNGEAVHGGGYTLRRVDMSGTIDGAGVFRNSGGQIDVLIEDSYIHDLYVAQYEYGRDCTPSHSDGIQVHYGYNAIIRHNTISPGNSQANAAIMVDQASSYYTSHLTIEDNWLDYGACTINVADKNKTPTIQYLSIINNKFGNNRRISNCAMIMRNVTRDDPTNTVSGNTWEDGHTPAPIITNGG